MTINPGLAANEQSSRKLTQVADGAQFPRMDVAEPIKSIPPVSNRRWLAFLFAVPIGLVGALIGLGGAEFRLPVLAGPLRYRAKQAVPLNLMISLVTLATSLIMRGRSLSFTALWPLRYGISSMIVGAVTTAIAGTAMAGRLSEDRLHKVILLLLLGIGGLLIIEGFLPSVLPAFIPAAPVAQVIAGIGFGLAIGLVSSLLGVAGGELIIPTLIFGFGADIKTAGTASLCISLPTVTVGVLRYARQGAFSERQPLVNTVVPMSIGSVIGAVAGGLLVPYVPAKTLKIALGLILIYSAFKIFRKKGAHSASGAQV